jgi:hypothetical protein
MMAFTHRCIRQLAWWRDSAMHRPAQTLGLPERPRTLRRRYRLVSVAAVCLFLLSLQGAVAVPVPHNAAEIVGIVVEYAIMESSLVGIEPNQTLFSVRVRVEESCSIAGAPNLAQETVGQVVQVLSLAQLSPCLFGREVRLQVRVAGDEWTRRYWAIPGTIISGPGSETLRGPNTCP